MQDHDPHTRASMLRPRDEPGAARVTTIELFFDLVFAFAITQLSHTLLKDVSATGAVHVLLLFLAVWWAWIFTTWVTNWLDPDRSPVRLALLALMLAGLVLATAVPEAFGDRGLVFAASYAAMQVGRSLFMLAALGRSSPGNTRNFQRITLWLAVAALFWLAGGALAGPTRLGLWIAALAIEYCGPVVGFWCPGLGRSNAGDWNVAGDHLAERCSNFVLIALGESIVVTGGSFGDLPWIGPVLSALGAAFVGSVAMWWIYFDTGMERASRRIAEAADPGRLARLGYTYCHLPIVAGIVLCAVADEMALAHPDDHASPTVATVLIGSPALYLGGTLLFKWAVQARLPLSHLGGLALFALLALAPMTTAATPLALAAASTAVLVVVAGWETLSLRGPAQTRTEGLRS